MKIIGITGGIGSGKSVVLNILGEEFGAYIVEADRLAHRLMEPGEIAYKRIIQEFGADILDESKYINRVKLGSIVFNNEEKLNILNNIVHPAVKQTIINMIEEQKKCSTEYFIIEAALLIQDGYKNICDEIWYIYSNKELRISRLIEYRGYTRERAESVISSQEPDEYFRTNSNRIVNNESDTEQLKIELFNILH